MEKTPTPKKYRPSQVTIDALKQYSGIQDQGNKLTKSYTSPLLAVVLVVSLIVIGGLIIRPNTLPNHESVEQPNHIRILKYDSMFPSTVVMEVSNAIREARLFVGEGDKSKKVGLGTKNMYYYYSSPGLYKLKLKNGSKVISNIEKVYVQSNGWTVYHYNKEMDDSTPIDYDFANNPYDHFQISESKIDELRLDIHRKTSFALANFHPYQVEGDHMRLNFDFKVTSKAPGAYCHKFAVQIRGREGVIYQQFNSPGCAYWLICKYGNTFKQGRNNDLSVFAMDLNNWRTVCISTHKQHIEIHIDDKRIFQMEYEGEIGEVIGLKFTFSGNGFIDNVALFDDSQKLRFSEGFGNPITLVNNSQIRNAY